MKYSEKKKINHFFNLVIDKIAKSPGNYCETSRLCHNAKIEIVEFLDDDLKMHNLKTFKPKE